jgi:hypothetical protein
VRSSHFRSFVVCAFGMLAASCGSADSDTGPGSGEQSADIGVSQDFVVWNPDLGGGQLIQQHVDWHTKPCSVNGQPQSGQVGVGRRCTKRGEDFLLWHRTYVHRLRAEFQRQGRTEDITGWYALPSPMKSTANGWTAALQTAENNIFALTNAGGTRFATLDEFGTYVEGQYHNWLHGIASSAYGESVVSGVMSPQSTYFFKIHGLIDWHLSRFLRGDFNWDGKSDVFVRNRTTGVNQFWLMNNTSVSSTVNTNSVAVDACNWYVGATPDITMDGTNDLIWHGPGCSAVHAWRMNGLSWAASTALPNVGNDWTLIGHGDFNADQRPDLVWRHNASLDASVWIMNGTTYVTSVNYDIPAGWQPIGVADVTDNGPPDFIYRRVNGGSAEYAVHYTLINGALGGQFNITGLSSDQYAAPRAFGRYQHRGALGDFLVTQHPPANVPGNRSFSRLSSVTMGYPTYSAPTGWVALSAGQVVQGPR